MAREVSIGGKTTRLPGVYSFIKSGVTTPPVAASFGRAVLIDTGRGAGFSDVIGVGSANFQGIGSILEVQNLTDYRQVIRGGELWDLGLNLFKPAGIGSDVEGVSSLYVLRAATTAPSSVLLTLGDTAYSIQIKTRAEGLSTVASYTSGILSQGYLLKMISQNSQYMIEGYVSSSTGLLPYQTSKYYNGVTPDPTNSLNRLVSSPLFSTPAELVNYLQNDPTFLSYFSIGTITGTLPSSFVAGDLTANATKPFTGGTETYSTSNLDKLIELFEDLDFSVILAPDSGSNALSIDNLKLLYYCQQVARFKKDLYVGGADDATSWGPTGQSTLAVEGLNSTRAVVVHGGYRDFVAPYVGLFDKSSYLKAGRVMGRVCGLEPQVPLTFKVLNLPAERHQLTLSQREYAQKKGILVTIPDRELGSSIQQGINSLQNNNTLILSNGDSYSIQLERIKQQLNKELVIEGKKRFFGTEQGPNRSTVSAPELKVWVENYLKSRTATNLQDNLILRGGNVQITFDGDKADVKYEFVPNFEVNKIVFTGFILEN